MNHPKPHFRCLTLVTLMALLGSSVQAVRSVSAAVIVVNSAADDVADDGVCTLREAIIAANTDAPYNGCSEGSEADIITFEGDYIITLDGAQLPIIESEITIIGKGSKNTIIQASTCNPVTLQPDGCTPVLYRVFEVATNGNLSLDGVTVRHGNVYAGEIYEGSGGGIFNRGMLTVANSTFSGNMAYNSGGGIRNDEYSATLTITNSTLSGNTVTMAGGGIYNSGTLIVSSSTLSGNTSTNFSGGGIENRSGSTSITNSTLSGNRALSYGGGIHNLGSLSMTNCTLSDNSVWGNGGGIANWGYLEITNSTLFGNVVHFNIDQGGGIYNGWDLNFKNTIIAESTSGDCVNHSTILAESTHNLVQDGGCPVSNLTNLDGDPMLGPLTDNGGQTWTHALLSGSPAMDAGDPETCAANPVSNLDQRGFDRPKDGDMNGVAVCDIGAFEFDPYIDGLNFIFLPLIMK